jgi:putative membrane protein
MARNPFSTDDLAAIEAAVRAAETRTSGEIYCVVAEDSGDDRLTPLAWAAGVALLAPAILLLAGVKVSAPSLEIWSSAQVVDVTETLVRAALIGTLMLQAALFVATFLLVSIPALRRALTPRGFKRDRVVRHAEEQFLSKNLHATRDRTGVLIYVSLAERMAELIADEGIDAKVAPETWNRAMAALTSGLKRGAAAEGFIAAIDLCGGVLAEHFPPRAGDNPNELSDAVVILPGR